jgi:CubicO group peptidase (beta-lactamase class C family)
MEAEGVATAIEHLLGQGIRDGSFPGAQLYASVGGQVVADVAIGEARLGTPMTTETLVAWGCNTKAVTAAAAWQLVERGLIDIDSPVATYVPGYDRFGKQDITPRHLLNHTAGFAYDPPFSVLGPLPFERVVELVHDASVMTGWPVGEDFRYSTFYGYASLAVLVSNIDGRPFNRYVRDEIFTPLGMDDCWIGVDADAVDSVSRRTAFLYNTAGPQPELPPFGGLVEGKELGSCSPSTGGIGPIRQLARFWESTRASFIGSSSGLLRPETVRTMVGERRDPYGLGPLTIYGYFGDWCPRAFGHDGLTSTLAFYDPDHDVVVVGALNGMDGRSSHRRWIGAAGRLVYERIGTDAPQGKSVRSWIRRLSSR